MFKTIRYRWYYPKCFRIQLPRDHALFLWVFSPLWPGQWWRRKVWDRDPHRLAMVLTLGPLEFTLTYPIWSRLARRH